MATQFPRFDLEQLKLTRYLFFTGKGGVGKTSTACSVAVHLADRAKKVLLISTDPASNLEDVFGKVIDEVGVEIEGVPGLTVVNLNPEAAANAYKESVVGPYRGMLPDSVIVNMEEQLSGSCTVEIAAFDQFSTFITEKAIADQYDHIVFDTAPTGHTLRMLQLPSAWTHFISDSTHGASCLGQLAGLESKKVMYQEAVGNLADPDQTTLILVSRPEELSLYEAERSSVELKALGIHNQLLIINGVLSQGTDGISNLLFKKQQAAMKLLPLGLADVKTHWLPLRSYNVLGLSAMRAFLQVEAEALSLSSQGDETEGSSTLKVEHHPLEQHLAWTVEALVDDLHQTGKRVIFTMGKGGVGKTTIAATLAVSLANRGIKVHLTSTDPADHIQFAVNDPNSRLTVSRIDEKAELLKYQNEVLEKARETMNDNDLEYIAEDLRSPCTQEIAVFRAFAEIVDKAENEVVVIDTAPTGHTLLLLDATQSYHREVERTKGETPQSVQNLLPRLRDASQTAVVIVTLPEATPVFEANRLQQDLNRAGIQTKWWIVNQCLSMTETNDPLLKARAASEHQWLSKVREMSSNHIIAVPWAL